jgi:hypothetical protein
MEANVREYVLGIGIFAVVVGSILWATADGRHKVYTEKHANFCYRVLKRISATPDTVWPVEVAQYTKDETLKVMVVARMENRFGATVRQSLHCEFAVPDVDPLVPLSINLNGAQMPREIIEHHAGMIRLDLD